MPYIFKEELDDGEAPADVVERENYDAVITERDELITQRDALIERAQVAEDGWREARNKYADAFITNAQRIKDDQRTDVSEDGRIQTFDELWEGKGKYGAY